MPSTARTRQKHRGQSHRSRVWSSPAPRKARFGSRRRKTGLKCPTTYYDAIHFTDQHRLESQEPELPELGSLKHLRMGSSEQRHLDHHRTSKQLHSGSLDQLHLGSPEHQLDQQHRMESLDHRHLGPPDHQLSQGSTDRQCPLHPGSHQLRLSQILEPRPTTRPTAKRRFTRSQQQNDSRGKTSRQDVRNQHRTIKSHWRYLRPSCTPASQPQAFSPSWTKSP